MPANKMKRQRTRVVPLSRQAIAILKELHTLTGNTKYLFPNSRKPYQMMSPTAINRALEYIGVKNTGHDFRATAATYLHEMGYDERFIETQLAHAKEDLTKAAYNHAKYYTQRTEMMQAWSDWLEEISN